MLRTKAMLWLLAIPFILGGNAQGMENDDTWVQFGPGFSAAERRGDTTWRWMAGEGIVKLKNLGEDMTLTIVGSAPLYALPEAPTMRISLNGQQLGQFRPPENLFEKEYDVPAAFLGNEAWSELRITTDKVFVPKEFNKKSSDSRRLGFQLSLLRWGKATGVNEPKTFLAPPFPLQTPVDERILTVAFSPGGQKLVTAGAFQPGQLKIWDVATVKEQVSITGIPGVRAVAFSPDGTTLASGHFGGSISLRHPDTGQERALLKGHTLGVNSLAFSPDGTALVSAGLDRTVKLWDVQSREVRKTFLGHTDMVLSVAFFRHGQAIVTGSKDQTAIIWDVATGKEKVTMRGHRAGVEAVAVSPEDKLVATASWDQTIKLWDGETGKEVAVLDWQTVPDLKLFASKCSVYSVAFSPDGQLLAAGGADGSVRLWDMAAKKPLCILGKHATIAWAVAFSQNGKNLASGSADKTAKLWDLTALKERATLLAGSPEGQRITALAYAPDGKVVAFATGNKAVKICDAKTGAVRTLLSGHAGEVTCLAFSPDGQSLASGSADQTVKLWDWMAAKEKHTLTGHAGTVAALAFTADGAKLASAGGDMAIHIWDPPSGKKVATYKSLESAGGSPLLKIKPRIQALAMAPGTPSLASGNSGGFINIWDLANGTERISFQAHQASVWALAFASDGKLASSDKDGSVKIWDALQGQELLTLKGHPGSFRALAFTPQGRILVGGGQDGILEMWDTATGRPPQTLHGHNQAIVAVAMHPQGRNMISASREATLLRWHGATGSGGTTQEPFPAKDENQAGAVPDKSKTSPDGQAASLPDPPLPQSAPRIWLLLAFLIFATLTCIVLVAWLHGRRNRSAAMAVPPLISFACSSCGKKLQSKGELAGKKIKCPKCGRAMSVPDPRTDKTRRPAAPRWAVLLILSALAVGAAYLAFKPQDAAPALSYLDQPLGTKTLPGIHEEGFYEPEVSIKSGVASRWTNGSAKLVVPLEGAPPKAMHVHLAVPVPRPRLRIRVNGQDLFDDKMSQNEFAQTFDLSAWNLSKELTVEILSDTYVPAEQQKGSADRRKLGVRVLAITLLSAQSL